MHGFRQFLRKMRNGISGLDTYNMGNSVRSISAILLGVLTALIFISYINRLKRIYLPDNSITVNVKLDIHRLKRTFEDHNGTTYRTSPQFEINFSQVNRLRKNIRILCYVNTHPSNYRNKSIHVHQTWARHCTKHIFTSTQPDPLLPIALLNLTYPEVRLHLWSKMRKILRYIYQYIDQFDYFLKTDDDTYVLMDNLRYALQFQSPDDPFMMGHLFNVYIHKGYFSGGAGYLLSREALRRIVEKAIDRHPFCPRFDQDMEDIKMSICGQAVGVRLYNALDPYGRVRFRWRSPEVLLAMHSDLKLKWRPVRLDPTFPFSLPYQTLISDTAISFHYVHSKTMYLLSFFEYHLRPVGIVNDFVS